MAKTITPIKIKQNNRNLIYKHIYKKEKLSLQEICFDLHLSRPTVSSNLNELENDGLIVKNGQFESEVAGRKATAYSIDPCHRIALGVEILNHEIKMIAVDLYGRKINRFVYPIDYSDDENYYEELSMKILEFKNSISILDENVLGIGFAMQALIAPDHETVIYSKILKGGDLKIERLQKYFPYPCHFYHDAYCAAIAELWVQREIQDACYLSISNHLGAAVIRNGQILSGKHGHNATIEHIQIQPKGQKCYCGKYGCVDTLCSIHVLLQDKESLDSFFQRLRLNDVDYRKRWDDFLTNLAHTINFAHLIEDCDFILGGYLAAYITEEDIDVLYDKIAELSPFPEGRDFLMLSCMPKHNIAIGAALPSIQQFLSMFEA